MLCLKVFALVPDDAEMPIGSDSGLSHVLSLAAGGTDGGRIKFLI